MLRTLGLVGVAMALAGWVEAYTVGAKESKKDPAQAVYRCDKIDAPIVVDGKLDENAWVAAPSVKFVHITEGTEPFYRTEGRMLWDDEYFYVGFSFEEPDIRAYWAMKDALLPDDFRLTKWPPVWDRNECAIMSVDRFAKIFLDPDGDGSGYLEFQINPLNNVFDAWYKQGFTNDQWEDRNRFPHVDWACPGLLSATDIRGSINNPADIDQGWSLEVAIPWSALKPFTQGACPPKNGDIWGAHLGRVFRDQVGGDNAYWVWPFLGFKNCHLPDRYAKLIFEDKLPKFERFFAWGAKDDETFIQRAAAIGVTDLVAGNVSPKLAALCATYKLGVYTTITLSPSQWKAQYPDKPVPAQQLSDAENKTLTELKGETYVEDHPSLKGQPEAWNPTKDQQQRFDAMGKNNWKIQRDYAWGGEPSLKYCARWGRNREVLCYDILCFNHPEVRDLIKKMIAKAVATPGTNGIAFDGIGYQNYYCCYCPICEKLFKEHCQKRGLTPDEKARNRFSLDSLVGFQNEMVDYAKSIKPDVVTVNHIWPTFLPEPVYGNRLKIDYCGQTASWYMYWDPFRIAAYAKTITDEENKYFPKVKGVPFIGYYDAKKHPQFPYKSPERVELELRAILRGGGRAVMMCGLDDLLGNPDVAAVFKKFMKKQ